MAAKSKNYFDVLRWVEDVIESVQNYHQWTAATRLIRNFREQYNTVRDWRREGDVQALRLRLSLRMKNVYEKKTETNKDESKPILTLDKLRESVSQALDNRGTVDQDSPNQSKPTPPGTIFTRSA